MYSNTQTKEIKYFYVILVCAGTFYLHSQMKDEVLTLLNCHDKYVKLPYHPILLSSASDLEECTLDTQADTTRIFHFGILEQF